MTLNFPRQHILALIIALPILFAAPPIAHSSTDPAAVDVLQVRAYRQQELQTVVSGFAVNAQGAVLTSAHALRYAVGVRRQVSDGRDWWGRYANAVVA